MDIVKKNDLLFSSFCSKGGILRNEKLKMRTPQFKRGYPVFGFSSMSPHVCVDMKLYYFNPGAPSVFKIFLFAATKLALKIIFSEVFFIDETNST